MNGGHTDHTNSNLEDEQIKLAQIRFFEAKSAGCLFAAAAARDCSRYGWEQHLLETNVTTIDQSIERGIASPQTTTLSLIFPSISTSDNLRQLIGVLKRSSIIFLEHAEEYEGVVCLGFRARINTDLASYVTGFGTFDFLPKTRHSPYVEITMRVKPRPDYDFVFKDAPAGIVHLADLDMLGMTRDKLWTLWENSFAQTEKILGAKPDIRSAARTTFCLPKALYAAI